MLSHRPDRHLYETPAALTIAVIALAELERMGADDEEIEAMCDEVIRRRLLLQESEIGRGWRPGSRARNQMARDHLLIQELGSIAG